MDSLFPNYFGILSTKEVLLEFFSSSSIFPSKVLHASVAARGGGQSFLWHGLQVRYFHTIGTSSWAVYHLQFFTWSSSNMLFRVFLIMVCLVTACSDNTGSEPKNIL